MICSVGGPETGPTSRTNAAKEENKHLSISGEAFDNNQSRITDDV